MEKLQPSAIILGTLDTLASDWCLFRIDAPPEPLFMGMCKLSEIFIMTEARRNSEFVKRVSPDAEIVVIILQTGTRTEMGNALRDAHIAGQTPVCNRVGYNLTGMASKIICNETQQEFRTQTECAKAMGIAQGHLSLHLSGSRSHRRVKGYTFTRR